MEAFFTRLQRETDESRQRFTATPIIGEAVAGRISLAQYQAYLAQAYHHVKHTVPLMMAAGSRLPERNEWVRTAFAEYIEEEIGHEQWILNDLRATGANAEALAAQGPQTATELMVAYAYDTVTRKNPVGLLGMVYVLEGTSTALASKAAEAIMVSLNLPRNAFTYLISHGTLDVGHMEFFANLVNRLEAEEDKQAVIHTARMMFELFGNVFRTLPQTQYKSEAA